MLPLPLIRAAMPPAPSRGMAARLQSGGMAAALLRNPGVVGARIAVDDMTGS